MTKDTFTLTEIARQLDLAPSTCRYYRDLFEAYLPSEGEGRRRRYRPEAIEVLQTAAACMAQNMSAADTEAQLASLYPRTIEIEPQALAIRMQGPLEAMERMTTMAEAVLEQLEAQQREIKDLKVEVAALRNEQEARDLRLVEHLKESMIPKRRSWWPFGQKQ